MGALCGLGALARTQLLVLLPLACAAVLQDFGAIDILVNNAAANPYAGPIIDIDLSRWEKTLQVNMTGPLVWTQLAWQKHMQEHGGSVINYVHDYSLTAGDWVPVVLHWDGSGLDFTYDGIAIATNLATPGFVPAAGDRFAFSARTGGANQNTYLDDLSFTTTTETASPA